jgi:hypothetical protein
MPSSKVVARGRYLDSNQWMQHAEVSVQSVNHARLSNAEFKEFTSSLFHRNFKADTDLPCPNDPLEVII